MKISTGPCVYSLKEILVNIVLCLNQALHTLNRLQYFLLQMFIWRERQREAAVLKPSVHLALSDKRRKCRYYFLSIGLSDEHTSLSPTPIASFFSAYGFTSTLNSLKFSLETPCSRNVSYNFKPFNLHLKGGSAFWEEVTKEVNNCFSHLWRKNKGRKRYVSPFWADFILPKCIFCHLTHMVLRREGVIVSDVLWPSHLSEQNKKPPLIIPVVEKEQSLEKCHPGGGLTAFDGILRWASAELQKRRKPVIMGGLGFADE